MGEAMKLTDALAQIAEEAEDRRDQWASEVIKAAANAIENAKANPDGSAQKILALTEKNTELLYKIEEMKAEIQALRDDLKKAHELSGYYYGRAKAFEEMASHRDETT